MIYFDNAATTPILNDVKESIIKKLDDYGNPSSNYDIGKKNKQDIHKARCEIEKILGVPPESFIFTGSGSESDNIALFLGWMWGKKRNKNKIITSKVEHHAILNACEKMKRLGAEIVYVDVKKNGCIDMSDFVRKIDDKTAIVSIMMCNNETGSIMDIQELSRITHNYGALFHTDAVQGVTINPYFWSSNIDMFSISAHKFGGPKGIGGLMVIPHLHSELADYSLINGGKQEFGFRAGTENIPYIVGMAKALNNLKRNFRDSNNQEKQLRDYAIEQLVANFPYIKVNGEISNYSHPGILNFSIGYADAASVVEWMNLYDICISSGSACNTGSNKPSHVLTSMGLTEKEAFSSIRLSFSAKNTKEEIDEFIRALKEFESRFYY